MEVQNCPMMKSYALRDDKLRRLEEKQRSVIKILNTNIRRIDELEARAQMEHKASKFRRLRHDYTFKLPATSKRQPQANVEVFKHGWRVRSDAEIPKEARRKLQQRSQMILAGNVYSLRNKATSQTKPIQRAPQNKSLAEIRKEILVTSKEIGNRYSQLFMKGRRPSINIHDDIQSYHRLLLQKDQLERDYQRFQESLPDSVPLQTANLLDTIREAETSLNIENRGKICWSILNLVPTCREEILSNLSNPCTHQKLYGKLNTENFCGVFDMETIAKASAHISEKADEYRAKFAEEALKDELDGKVTAAIIEESIDEGKEADCELLEEDSAMPTVDYRDEEFDKLEAHFIESVQSQSTDSNAREDFMIQPAAAAPSIVSSPENLTDDKLEIEFSPTKIDDNNGKVSDISTSASTFSSKQLQVSSLIDDVSTFRAFDANLALMQEIPRDNAMPVSNGDDNGKEKFELSHKSHEMTWQSSNPSLAKLHKASTFTSTNDIFEKRMEALRARLGDVDAATKKRPANWCESECILNEVVKQVVHFPE